MKIKGIILVVFLILSACNSSDKNESPTVNNVVIDSIDLYPKYPGCEDYYQQNEQLACLTKKMNTFINYLINKKYKKDFTSLHDTIWANFVIDTTGMTLHTGVLYKNEDSLNIDKLIIIFQDIAKKIPKIEPAVYHDKPVNFEFKIPVINKENLSQ